MPQSKAHFFYFLKAYFVALFDKFGIDLERNGNIFVPQHFAHPNDVRTLADQLRCKSMSDIVQRSGFDAGLFEDSLKIYMVRR